MLAPTQYTLKGLLYMHLRMLESMLMLLLLLLLLLHCLHYNFQAINKRNEHLNTLHNTYYTLSHIILIIMVLFSIESAWFSDYQASGCTFLSLMYVMVFFSISLTLNSLPVF